MAALKTWNIEAPAAEQRSLPSVLWRPRPIRAAHCSTVEFGEILRRQCAEFAGTFASASGITITCTAVQEQLPLATATRLALIALGLIASAFNSFDGRRPGRIGVSLCVAAAALELTVEHSGPGTHVARSQAVERLKLVRRLVARLGAQIESRRVIGGVRIVVMVPTAVAFADHGAAEPRPTPRSPLPGDWDMDDELRTAVDQRAHALWEAAGRPDGHELVYRLRAEREIGKSPLAEKRDPLIALGEREPGVVRNLPLSSEHPSGKSSRLTDEPLRRAVENAIPEAERLPGGAEENPISERVRDAADGQPPPTRRSTFQGGSEVAN